MTRLELVAYKPQTWMYDENGGLTIKKLDAEENGQSQYEDNKHDVSVASRDGILWFGE